MNGKWFIPEQMISTAFINSYLQPTGTPRLALIFEFCRTAGNKGKSRFKEVLENWENTWFQDFVSPRPDVQKFEFRNVEVPNYFVNYAVAGRKLDHDDPFYTRSHLGIINEEPCVALAKFISVYGRYKLLPQSSAQGDMVFSEKGNLAKLLSSFHPEFTTSLEYNPLEGQIVSGLARHAIISCDFGFIYEMLKQINERLDVSSGIALRAKVGPFAIDIINNLNALFTTGDTDLKSWLLKTRQHLIKKQGDFERRGECTAANDLIQQRCMMLVDAGLIETKYGYWEFYKFGEAYAYFEKVHQAIHKLSNISDLGVLRLFRSWFGKRPQVLLPLAWNYFLNEIEIKRKHATVHDYERLMMTVLSKMAEQSLHRLRLIEFFSILHIIETEIYYNPIQVFEELQKLAANKIIQILNNHGDPILIIRNRRKLMPR